MSIPVKTQLKLSLSSACFSTFTSGGSGVGESIVFCLFAGGGGIEVDVDFCGVGVFGVEGQDCTPGEDPPVKSLLAFLKAEELGYLTYNSGLFG